METEKNKMQTDSASSRTASVSDMTVGSPLRQICKFALPLILGYILQQMYLVIDAASACNCSFLMATNDSLTTSEQVFC